MLFSRDYEAYAKGLENGARGKLALDGLPAYSDGIERALCLAGFESARLAKGIGRLPILLHTGCRAFWLVSIRADNPGAFKPVYNATLPGEKPAGDSGYHDLRSLFPLKGESF